MNDFKAAIFDLDGTLLDSMNVWTTVDSNFLAKRGQAVPEFYVKDVSAMSFFEAAVYTINLFSLNEKPEDVMAEWLGMALYEYSHNVSLKPHAREYLLKLKALGIKLGVATGLTVNLMNPVLENNGIYDIFDAVCSTDSVGCGKGTPEIFIYTAKKLNTAPEKCIVFEDIPQGIRSAKAAGMSAYGVYDRHAEKFSDEIKSNADGYITDFTQAPLFKANAD